MSVAFVIDLFVVEAEACRKQTKLSFSLICVVKIRTFRLIFILV